MGGVGIVVTGAMGRMGSGIIRALMEDGETVLLGACEKDTSEHVGQDLGLALGFDRWGIQIQDDLGRAIDSAREANSTRPHLSQSCEGNARAEEIPPQEESVPLIVIDFTFASASAVHARICAEKGVGIVIGSTGFDSESKAAVTAFSTHVPIIMAPNMSVGVNLLLGLVRKAAGVLGADYDVEILELHHRMKRDAPSGTAARLGEVVAEVAGKNLAETGVFERSGDIGARTESEIGIQSLRGGDVPGEHTVFFFGQDDRIELTHRATNRRIFVDGAIRAAKWLADKSPGLYGMWDVLQLD